MIFFNNSLQNGQSMLNERALNFQQIHINFILRFKVLSDKQRHWVHSINLKTPQDERFHIHLMSILLKNNKFKHLQKLKYLSTYLYINYKIKKY